MPATIMDNHMKNVEKASAGGKFNPNFGLANSGIAGTGNDKDDEESKEGNNSSSTSAANDEDSKDPNKKDGKQLGHKNNLKFLANERVWLICKEFKYVGNNF